jgi:hypothetical protein
MNESAHAAVEPGAGSSEETPKTFQFVTGQPNPSDLVDWLASLKPEQVAAAYGHMMNRAMAVEFKDGEAESIVRNIIARDRHLEDVAVLEGLKLRIQSLSEDDFASINGLPSTIGDKNAIRARQVRTIALAVTHENGRPLAMALEDAEKYWRNKSYAMLDIIASAVGRIDRKVQAALADQEVLGKS